MRAPRSTRCPACDREARPGRGAAAGSAVRDPPRRAHPGPPFPRPGRPRTRGRLRRCRDAAGDRVLLGRLWRQVAVDAVRRSAADRRRAGSQTPAATAVAAGASAGGEGLLRAVRREEDPRPLPRAGCSRRRACCGSQRMGGSRGSDSRRWSGARSPVADPGAAAERERRARTDTFARATRSTEDGMRGFCVRAHFAAIARLDATVEHVADALEFLGIEGSSDERCVARGARARQSPPGSAGPRRLPPEAQRVAARSRKAAAQHDGPRPHLPGTGAQHRGRPGRGGSARSPRPGFASSSGHRPGSESSRSWTSRAKPGRRLRDPRPT